MKTIEEIQAAFEALPKPFHVEWRKKGSDKWGSWTITDASRVAFGDVEYRTPQPPKKRLLHATELRHPCWIKSSVANQYFLVTSVDPHEDRLFFAGVWRKIEHLATMGYIHSTDQQTWQDFETIES